jgi:mitogen-activated protein kinase 1/3
MAHASGEATVSELGPDYKFGARIGAGAYSSVWDAVHVPTGKRVAIKKEVGVFDDLTDCKRLLRETKLLRGLRHPNVVKLLEVLIPPDQTAEDFDTIYLVLEMAEASLQKLVRSSLQLDDSQLQNMLYNMLVGLNYVHSAGVIHRDIKPGNVLINSDCSVRLCDFGLARSLVEVDKPKGSGPAANAEPSSDSDSDSNSEEEDKGEKKEDKHSELKKTPGKARFSISAAATQEIKQPHVSVMPPPALLVPSGITESPPKVQAPTNAGLLGLPSDGKKTMAPLTPVPKLSGRQELTRRLTMHVVTRWYRSPEIILLQAKYGPPVDVWAMGCIFAEMLLMSRKANVPPKERKALFPGSSCTLLSPAMITGRSSILAVGSNDQLAVVLDVLGPLSNDDWSFIEDANVVEFLKEMTKGPRKKRLQEKCPSASPEALDLLDKMLAFNPLRRISAAACLAHPYFKEVRLAARETKAPAVLSFDFESEGELGESRLRSLFAEELNYYQTLRKTHKTLF